MREHYDPLLAPWKDFLIDCAQLLTCGTVLGFGGYIGWTVGQWVMGL